MSDFWFYVKLGLNHVLDLSAYDHILFLAVLAIPFTFKSWKKIVLLATVFTIAHCTSLALSTYNLIVLNVTYIEFLIPVTILITAIFNIVYAQSKIEDKSLVVHTIATVFFGLIHGFGFSNYFKMLMSEETNKIGPLFGFATGIELSQVTIILLVLCIAYILQAILKVKQKLFITITSIVVLLITIPILIDTFPF
ncbi:HupE/UreJ family protein [Cellulophaga sp. HaHaR_3_176]|uniref:HupE/UreJ family protein n=1 Tax=Cellulophaga sp. HaHaR_3_176 TaxID=1942464 RepID=UPI001C1F5F1B|nr:HupE/UreJ family protein [Cellulophaga sp. HaHaR_3_176]QWX83787.1 HupE/UreJ family protein [Cellulophaga sp. HaHaR_3_176]